ncbi:hypothetical protein KSS87_023314 [Heliosperma pusillum]|nr:hypothetical protein KSS87_023314 [Heliosperma pusillum]
MRKSKSKAKAGDAAVEIRGISAAIRREIAGDFSVGDGGVTAAESGGFGGKRGREEVGVGDKERLFWDNSHFPTIEFHVGFNKLWSDSGPQRPFIPLFRRGTTPPQAPTAQRGPKKAFCFAPFVGPCRLLNKPSSLLFAALPRRPNSMVENAPAEAHHLLALWVGINSLSMVEYEDLFTHESTPLEWTDEKHSLYLKSMEASFVQQLYSSIESSGLQSRRKHLSHLRSRNQTESNSTGQYKVQQNGCWQRIPVGRGEPRPRQFDERQFLLQNPWIQHFRTKGRENKAVQENASFEGQPIGGQGRTMYTCGFGNIKEHTSSTQAYQDSNICREFSDQNFDDKDSGGGGGGGGTQLALEVACTVEKPFLACLCLIDQRNSVVDNCPEKQTDAVMQGQRGAVGSLPDSINFEYESLTTNLDMDPQLCWNDLRNSSENTSMGNISQEGQTLSRWNTVGSSSSAPQNLVGQIGWSPPINTSIGGNRVSQPIVNLNLNTNDIADEPTFVRGSGSGSASQNFDLNEGRFHRVGNDNSPKPIGYDSKFHHMSGSSSGSSMFPVDDPDGRPLDGRRVSCKRKTFEGNVGQSSSNNGGNFFSRAEASMWRPLPSHFDASSSMNIAVHAETPESSSNLGLPEEVNPRLGLGIGGGRDNVRPLNISGVPERSHRNYRLRMSSSVQQDSTSNNSFLPVPASVTRHPDIQTVHQPLRFVPMIPPLDLMSPIPSETAVPQNQSVAFGLPSQRNVQAHRWNSLRSGISSSSSMFGEADDAFPDGSRSLPRNIGEHPVFAPPVEARNLASHPPHWTSNGGAVLSRNTGSSSRSRSNARSHSSGGPSQDSQRHPTQYSRRLSEYVRRSLLSTGLPEVTGQSSSSQQHPVAASSQDGVLPPSGGNQGQSHPQSRSALWLERQADGTGGIPYLRALAAAGEGRSRIVSEIRNALNSIRRGEGLRIEDLMLLDQSIYFGRAEIHDQHRDMRLDVDNMSYEELLALEERIGNVCTGLSEEMIVKSLKERKHVPTSSDDQTEAEPCCVCQELYSEGEYIGTLDCGHDFHKDCIKQWLSQKNLCPICKTTGLATK